MNDRRSPEAWGSVAPSARVHGLAWVTLAIASLALSGCASVLYRHAGPASAGVHVASAMPLDPLSEARAEMAQDSTGAWTPYHLAQVELAGGSPTAAEQALAVSLERDPCYAPAIALMSKLDFEAGRHQAAVDRLEAARARADCYPDDLPAALLAGLALHYQAMGRRDLAAASAATIPKGARGEAASAMVCVALLSENPDSAAGPAAAALRANQKSAVNQNNFGITRLRAGDPVAARQAFQAAIALDPKLPGPYYNLAILEKYYVFDDQAAAMWFASFRDRSQSDPDSLKQVFQNLSPTPLAEGAKP